GEVAERTWESVGRARAEKLLVESETKYHTLFESMDEGNCIIEVLFDEAEKPFDWRFIDVNTEYKSDKGLAVAAGQTILELEPDIEPEWFDIYGRVASTGESERFEKYSATSNRWWDIFAFPAGAPGNNRVAVLYNDTTRRKQAET